MRLSHYNLSPIKHAEIFEDFCCDLWRQIWKSKNTQKHGRKGQTQCGVDVFGIPDGELKYQGVQCKSKSNLVHSKLTAAEVRSEVAEAVKFDPPIAHLIIATTGPKDISIEKLAREITLENLKSGLFMVTVLGWEDIVLLLDEHESVAKKYYPNMYNTDSLSKKQEAFLVASNPTKLVMRELSFKEFIGDNEPYLTLELENTTKLDAHALEVSILLPKKPGETDSEIAKFSPSKCIDISKVENFSVTATTKQLIPLAPRSEVHQILSRDLAEHRLVGTGLSPEIPHDLSSKIRGLHGEIHFPCLSISSIGFGVMVKWRTIFEQEFSVVCGGFLYYWDEVADLRFAELTGN